MAGKKGQPVSMRFSQQDLEIEKALMEDTGLGRTGVYRLALRALYVLRGFSLPKAAEADCPDEDDGGRGDGK